VLNASQTRHQNVRDPIFSKAIALIVALCASALCVSARATCSEDGGSEICSTPDYSYGLCDEQGSFCGHIVNFCTARGGIWSGSCLGHAECPGEAPITGDPTP
jgi:hypothetical protein